MTPLDAKQHPRLVDNRPCVRPGGSQGGARPTLNDLPAGTTIAAWLTSGDVVHLEVQEPENVQSPDFGAIPWALVEWWLPV